MSRQITGQMLQTHVVKAFSNRSFMIAVIVMGVVGVGMQFATQFMNLYFKKEPVQLALALEKMPEKLGPWVQVSFDEPLPKDIEEALGTKEYIFRDYVDSRTVGIDKIEKFKGVSVDDRRKLLREIENSHPRAVVHLAVTYYTGMVDTVAHIPDRCYIADGYAPTEYDTKQWSVGEEGQTVPVRFINFEDSTFSSKVSRNVAYFFQVNGDLVSDPLMVRARLQNLFNRYGYYAKVELMTLLRDREEAARTMTDFLSTSLPEVRRCLPQPGFDKVAVKKPEG